MRTGIALSVLAALASATASADEKRASMPPAIPVLKPQNPLPARIFKPKPIDIPQWAKDEGHNGRATYWVSVTPDGKLDAFQLFESSGSKAIDDAVMAAITSATFLYGTNKDGSASFDQIKVSLGYGRWNKYSLGGGIDDYRCSNLIKEYDWFTKANDSKKIFALQNIYVSRDLITNVEHVDPADHKAMDKQLAKYTKEWMGLVKSCRKAPNALLLEKVKDPETFRIWVET